MTSPVTRRATFAALASRGDRVRHGAVSLRHLRVDDPDMQPATSTALAFALSRRFGNAVERNRARRRLRRAFEAAGGDQQSGAMLMSGSRRVLDCSYDRLVADVRSCLGHLTELDAVKTADLAGTRS